MKFKKDFFYILAALILLPLFAYATTPYTIRNNSDMTGPPVIGHTTANTAYFSNLHATNFSVTTVLATTIRTNGLTVNGAINANGGITAGALFITTTNTTTLNATTGTFTTANATTANLTGISTVGVKAQSIDTAGLKVRGVESPYYVLSSFVGGTQNTITLNPNPGISAYSGGQTFYFTAGYANTGNVTINVNGVGAKSVRKVIYTGVYSELTSSDIVANKTVNVIYDATTDYFIFMAQHQTQDHPFGDFWMASNATPTPMTVANTYYPIRGNAYANTVNSGFAFSSTGANSNILTYTGLRSQHSHIAITGTIQSASTADIVRIGLFKNGILLPNGTASTYIGTAADIQNIAFHVVTELVPNDYFELHIKSNDTNALTIVDMDMFIMGVYN